MYVSCRNNLHMWTYLYHYWNVHLLAAAYGGHEPFRKCLCEHIYIITDMYVCLLQHMGATSTFRKCLSNQVCMYTCMYVCMCGAYFENAYSISYVCICMHVCMYVWSSFRKCLSNQVCNVCMYVWGIFWKCLSNQVCMYICMYVFMYAIVFVCVYIYAYIYTHMHMYTHAHAHACKYMQVCMCKTYRCHELDTKLLIKAGMRVYICICRTYIHTCTCKYVRAKHFDATNVTRNC
jgi:hypothetical protein